MTASVQKKSKGMFGGGLLSVPMFVSFLCVPAFVIMSGHYVVENFGDKICDAFEEIVVAPKRFGDTAMSTSTSKVTRMKKKDEMANACTPQEPAQKLAAVSQ